MTRRRTLSRSLELAAAAPAVIALRSARMMAAGAAPTAADRREMSRMVTEKVGAFSQSWWLMASQQQRAFVQAWVAMAQAWWAPWLRIASAHPFSPVPAGHDLRTLQRRLQRAQAAVLASGLAPLHRTATANLRRLSRRSR